MPASTRSSKSPFVGRQARTRASALSEQVGLSTARVLEFLLDAHAEGRIRVGITVQPLTAKAA
ncbi:hypothetical protein ACIBFB_09915 [Nocardiopsis sp. NPDC050513]|uniref:hypothetical protein n=1 Tax=Nocardiopsis sp. NPDC050513 TaxID=3364338 RepID=UPI0037A26798